MSVEAIISELVRVFGSQTPNSVDACDLWLELALQCEHIDAEVLDNSRISLKLNDDETRVWEIPGSVGRFRSVLARLAVVFQENSNAARNPALLAPVGRLSRSRSGDNRKVARPIVIDPIWSPDPGSPFYNLDGFLLVEDRSGRQAKLHIVMQNTGKVQRLSITCDQ